MKISYATTCMGRLHHLRETLPQNIQDNTGVGMPDVEFVVLNYNSSDGMHDWMMTEMRDHIESGLVRYARFPDPETFHVAHAKNMAHRLATGDVVCNVDADNFTGPNFAPFIRDVCTKTPDAIVTPARSVVFQKDGQYLSACGRIAMTHDTFMTLGGYDETFRGWGYEDIDLVTRAMAAGKAPIYIHNKSFLKFIDHSDEERFENYAEQDLQNAKKIREADDTPSPSGEEGIQGVYSQLSRVWGRVRSKADSGKVYARAFSSMQANRSGDFGLGTVFLGTAQTPLSLDTVLQKKLNPQRIVGVYNMFAARVEQYGAKVPGHRSRQQVIPG